jgi:protein-disulfide isomerase
MHSLRYVSAVVSLGLGLGLAGCQKADPATQEKLDRLLTKVDSIEKKVAQIEAKGGAAGGAAAPARKRPDPATTYFIPVTAADPQLGAKHAKVTIVEAFEFGCPYCAILHKPMQDAVGKFKDDVKYVAKQFVVHPDLATDAALAACAAYKQGENQYAKFESKLWEKAWPMEGDRPKMEREQLKPEALQKIAAEVGLNVDKFKTDVASADCKTWVDQTRSQLGQVGVGGTPAIFINGRPYQGQRTADAIQGAIAEEIKKVDAALASGTKVEEYYDKLMSSAKKSL